MRIPKITTVAILVLAIAACNNDASSDMSTEVNLAEDAATDDVLGGTDPAPGDMAMPTDAAGFANAAAAIDLYEVESAKLAAEQGMSKDVKEFAGDLKADHQKSTAELKALATAANLVVMPALDAEKQAMLDQLKAAKGADFDKAFLDQQKTAHDKALALLQNYARSGDNETMRGFATKAATAVEGHIDHLGMIKI